MKYPSREECLRDYLEIKTPQNIIEHVIVVNKVAVFLAKKLKKKGIKLNLRLVDKASLLHDLDKWLCINDKSLKHGFETEKMLAEKGYPEIGFYARQHVAELILGELKTWEEKIINYADKRVLHDQIVSLKERFDYINERYPAKDFEKRRKIIELSYVLEKEIFSKLGFSPEELKGALASK